MPTWYGATGTGIVSRTETALLSGTATVSATPAVYVYGTGTADRTSLMAWAAQIRRTAVRVLLGEEAEDMVRLRDAVSINVDSGSPVSTASFRITDARCAYHAADSIATGGIPAAIRCRIDTDDARADTLVFSGLTEGATDEDPYVPTATIQAAGNGSVWLDSVGCIALAAFGGYTRAEILRQFAEAAGLDGDDIIGGEGSGVVNLALDLSGLSVWELARRFAEIEDWYLRENDGTLELLPAAQVVGPLAEPVFWFDQSNYFSVRGDPPIRPTTKYILSTVGIPAEILTGGTEEVSTEIRGGTDSLGVAYEFRIVTTTYNGVTTNQRIEEWRDIAIPGVTPSAVAWRLWKLTETVTDWATVTVDGVALRTSRISTQTTTTTEWYSAPCRTADGFVWADGIRRIDNLASWQVTSVSETTYVYDSAPSCLLLSKTTNIGGWYSPLTDTGYIYDDGAERTDTAYQYIAHDAVTPYQRIEETYSEESSDTLAAVNSETVTSGYRIPVGSAALIDVWGEISGSTTRWSTVPGSGIVTEATSEFFADGSSTYLSKSYAGQLPVLVRASADIPQFNTEPLVLTATAAGDRYAETLQTETVFDAESMDDLIAVARRRFRDTLSPRVTILHPALPLLKLFDVVSVTDPTRELDDEKGYVTAYRLTLDALNGGMRQETTVVFPLSEYDPEVTV